MSFVSCACRNARASLPATCRRPYESRCATVAKVESPFYSLLLLKTLFALVFFGVLGAAGYAAWYATTPVAVAKLPAGFELPAGTRFRAAARRLEEAGIAVSATEFEILARALG